MGILKSKPKDVHTRRTTASQRTTHIGSDMSRSLSIPKAKAINVQASNTVVEKKTKQYSSESLSETKTIKVEELHGTDEMIAGYGYQFLDEYRTDPMKVSFPQAFNGGNHNLLSRKTSTCILINRNLEFEEFGYEAEERYEELCLLKKHEQFYFFKHFKMKLQELKGLEANFLLADENGSKELPAMIVFSQAIKCLMEHALQYVKDKRGNIDESSILWALTVPAIWNEAATQFMKDAAVKEEQPI